MAITKMLAEIISEGPVEMTPDIRIGGGLIVPTGRKEYMIHQI